jgi:hypothetical protein
MSRLRICCAPLLLLASSWAGALPATSTPPPAPPTPTPVISFAEAAQLALIDSSAPTPLLTALLEDERTCGVDRVADRVADRAADNDRTRCRIRALLGHVYDGDATAQRTALDLYERSGTVAGLLPEQDMDGAYRGQLHLVPHLPVGNDAKHLRFAADALLDFDDFFARLGAPVRFRWRPLGLRFFESVKRKTPSAFAVGWTVSYNVRGSLFVSAAAVRETFFHEIFHLNDQSRGHWSLTALGDVYRAIVARCGMNRACLKPYAPDHIVVRGGTYYAFMPDNGVTEYAADVARRYYVEQRALLHGQQVKQPFKCGPPENARAWQLVVDEFFGGIDRVPACR